jgi:hypothetical protein
VDQIVEKLSRDEGHFSTLLTSIIESTPFQKKRSPTFQETLPAAKPSDTRASLDK